MGPRYYNDFAVVLAQFLLGNLFCKQGNSMEKLKGILSPEHGTQLDDTFGGAEPIPMCHQRIMVDQ